MPAYYYSSTAGSYTLVGAVSDTATILSLNSVAGLPSATPFKVVLEPGQPTEEIVKVTGVAGTSLTVVRGWDGTAAVPHSAAVTVRHMITAEDFTLSRAHEDATAAHGATSKLVGQSDAQALTNKDLSSGSNTFPATFVTTGSAQTLTGKTMSGASNTFTDVPQSAVTGLSPMWQSLIVKRVAPATIPNTTATVVLWDTTVNSVGSIGLSGSTLTPSVAGVYAFSATCRWDPSATTAAAFSRRRINLQVNGVDISDGINEQMTQSGDSLNAEVYTTAAGQIKLAAGDVVKAMVYQSTGVPGGIGVSNISLGLTRIA